MSAFLHLLANEALKLRRTLALGLALLLPALVVVLSTLMIASRKRATPVAAMNFELNVAATWSMLVLPLFVALACVLVHGMEHRSGGWRRLYVLPVRRGEIYAAKLAACVILLALASLTLSLLSWSVGHALVAAGQLSGPVPGLWGTLARFTDAAMAISGVLVLQHWISMRWSSFVAPLAVAVAGTMSILTIANSEKHWHFDPWAWGLVASNVSHPDVAGLAVKLGLAMAAVVGLLGLVDLGRRDLA